MYQMNEWIDQVKNPDGSIAVVGTPFTRNRGSVTEKGVFETFIEADVLTQEMLQRKRELENSTPEIGQVTLTNNQGYPFNNSKVTVNLKKARNTLDYTVSVEYSGTNAGDVNVSDKQLNGFKLEYTGSAASVTVKYYVKGGMMQQ